MRLLSTGSIRSVPKRIGSLFESFRRRFAAYRRRESRTEVQRADISDGNVGNGTAAAAFLLFFSLQYSLVSTSSCSQDSIHFIHSFLPLIISSPSTSNRSSTFPFLRRLREPFSLISQVYKASIRKADTLYLAGKMEPNIRVFLPGDKDYLFTMQQLEEYLLQKYIQKRVFQKSWLFVGIKCKTTTLCRFLSI